MVGVQHDELNSIERFWERKMVFIKPTLFFQKIEFLTLLGNLFFSRVPRHHLAQHPSLNWLVDAAPCGHVVYL